MSPSLRATGWPARLSALLLAVLPWLAGAQVPTWQDAFSGISAAPTSGTSVARATAADASGNVCVTGYFSTQVAFGSTLLTSAGGNDMFVARWDATARRRRPPVAGGRPRAEPATKTGGEPG